MNIPHSVDMISACLKYVGYGNLQKNNVILLKMCHGLIAFMNWVNVHSLDTVVLCCNVLASAKCLQNWARVNSGFI